MNLLRPHSSSFKDPAGFMFQAEGNQFRHVNSAYAQQYDLLMSSGLYDTLTKRKWLIPHIVVPENKSGYPDWYKTLLPEQISFISYPYEWSFDQLKDAALLTLNIMKASVDYGMILKDANGFNITMHQGRMVFMDTLSFELYDPSKPWIAYRQFCECFLFPLLLGHYLAIDVLKWLTVYFEGIPVATAATLLPFRSRFRLDVWLHVFLQRRISSRSSAPGQQSVQFSKEKLLRLIDHLHSTVQRLQMNRHGHSIWSEYYTTSISGNNYLQNKEQLFRQFLNDIPPGRALDLGCNDGHFSKILAFMHHDVLAVDFDRLCINQLYKEVRQDSISNIQPLCIDLSNPSPAIGFGLAERSSFLSRGRSAVVCALALIHHLVLGKNIPLSLVALQFADICDKYLLIEFVPLEDEKAQLLVSNKSAFHKPYDRIAFEQAFSVDFEIVLSETIPGSGRTLYKMIRRLA